MTTTTTDTHALAEDLLDTREAIATLRQKAEELEALLLAAIRQQGGKALMDSEFRIEVKDGTPTYDESDLAPLLELLPDDEVAKVYEPAHPVVVPAKWSGTQLNRLERTYGGEIARIIKRARIPGNPKLVVERKK